MTIIIVTALLKKNAIKADFFFLIVFFPHATAYQDIITLR